MRDRVWRLVKMALIVSCCLMLWTPGVGAQPDAEATDPQTNEPQTEDTGADDAAGAQQRTTGRIALSVLPDLREPADADGAAVSGAIVLFLETDRASEINAVEWFIGQHLANRDSVAPFTFGTGHEDDGSDDIVAWDTTLLADGNYTILAVVLTSDGVANVSAEVSVRNNRAPRNRGLVVSLDDGGDGVGSLTVVPGSDENRLCFRIRIGTSEQPRATHIQFGQAGEKGSVFIDLRTAAHPYRVVEGAWLSEGCVRLSERSTAELLGDPAGHYLNITTPTQPSGAIRGQLTNIPQAQLTVALFDGVRLDGRATLGVVGDILCHTVVVQGGRPFDGRLLPAGGSDPVRLVWESRTLGTDGYGSWSLSGCVRDGDDRLGHLLDEPGGASLEVLTQVDSAAAPRGVFVISGSPARAVMGSATSDLLVATLDMLPDAVCYRVATGAIGFVRSLELVRNDGLETRFVLGQSPLVPPADGSGFSIVRGCRSFPGAVASALDAGAYQLVVTGDQATTRADLRLANAK